VTLLIEDELRREAAIARYTDEDQQALYPGDRFFQDLPNIANFRATWGVRTILHGGSDRPGGGGGRGGDRR